MVAAQLQLGPFPEELRIRRPFSVQRKSILLSEYKAKKVKGRYTEGDRTCHKCVKLNCRNDAFTLTTATTLTTPTTLTTATTATTLTTATTATTPITATTLTTATTRSRIHYTTQSATLCK